MTRPKTYRVRCAEPECREIGFFEYERASDKPPGDWRCSRHVRPDDVLSAASPVRSRVLTVVELDHGLFWHDGSRVGSGFEYGPGFRAWARDFPPGTTLTITAVIGERHAPDRGASS